MKWFCFTKFLKNYENLIKLWQMPITIECDGGCGKRSDNPKDFKEFGLVDRTFYCDDCSKKADEYLKTVDNLHDQVAKRWRNGLKLIRKQFEKSHSGFTLPDHRAQP